MNQFGINRTMLFRPYLTLNDLKADNDLDANMYCFTVDDGKLYKVVNNTVRTMADLFTTINDNTLDTTNGIVSYRDTRTYDHVTFDKFDEYDLSQLTKLNNSNMGVIIGKAFILGEHCHIIVHPEGLADEHGFKRVTVRAVNERNGEEIMRAPLTEVHPMSIKTGDIITISHSPRGFTIVKNNEDVRSLNVAAIITKLTESTTVEGFIPKFGIAVDENTMTGEVARFNIGNERIADSVLPNGKKLIGASMTLQNMFVDGGLTVSGTSNLGTTNVGTLSASSVTVSGAVTINGGTTTQALSTSDVTVRKNGNYSKILFPAIVNDPGFISHYEGNNISYMDFCVSDDDIASDMFRFGFGTAPGSFTSRAYITASGNMGCVNMTASTNISTPKLTLGGWEVTVV